MLDMNRESGLRILVVEDDPEFGAGAADALRGAGHDVSWVADGVVAIDRLLASHFDLVLTDIRLPHMDGFSIFEWVCNNAPGTRGILMSAFGDVPEAVHAIRAHAADYLVKPFELSALLESIERVAAEVRASRELDRGKLALTEATGPLLGQHVTMRALKERIAAVAPSEAAVLISGASGTGKELVARALHDASLRRDGPFIPVNCAAFPEGLLEAELFGHERGAFTGAAQRRDGRFQAASRGTLFLDEVTEMAPAAQAKLLRVLQEGTVTPLGTNKATPVDVRIISATNRDIFADVDQGRFRIDLLFRLKVFNLHLPRLSERRSDLPVLVQHFCRRYAAKQGSTPPRLSARAWAALTHYDFPGNVRELEHAIEHACILTRDDVLDIAHLPDEIRLGNGMDDSDAHAELQPLSVAMQQFEREYILRVMREVDWRRNEAAEVLRISRKTLWTKLRRLGIEDEPSGPDARSEL